MVERTSRGSFASEEDGFRVGLLTLRRSQGLKLEIPMDDTKDVQRLTLVLVQPLNHECINNRNLFIDPTRRTLIWTSNMTLVLILRPRLTSTQCARRSLLACLISAQDLASSGSSTCARRPSSFGRSLSQISLGILRVFEMRAERAGLHWSSQRRGVTT